MSEQQQLRIMTILCEIASRKGNINWVPCKTNKEMLENENRNG